MLEISCEKCGQLVCCYQKDGPGPLKRMYLDRMENFSAFGESLSCPNCSELLGLRIIYKKEDRPAFRLFVGSVTKRIVRA
jgi:hypothetical protein